MPHPLDNPVWCSLAGRHAPLARRCGRAARYPAEAAPFVAVEAADADAEADARQLVAPGESICFVGPAPPLSSGWRILESTTIAQLARAARLDEVAGPPIVALGPGDVDDLLSLTARVYPHYFRRRTIEMGRYFGIRIDGTLAAMAGERMQFDGHCEISAVCTDPAFLGRGYARRLIAMLTNDIVGRGDVAFLHFSHGNVRAKAVYEGLGFSYRAEIPLVVAMRV